MSDDATRLARARLLDALEAVVKCAADERVRLAYEHGYLAGKRDALTPQEADQRAREVERGIYRRGYSAGYTAGTRGKPEAPDGTGTGRPRKLEAV
jgi:hypothetical protein